MGTAAAAKAMAQTNRRENGMDDGTERLRDGGSIGWSSENWFTTGRQYRKRPLPARPRRAVAGRREAGGWLWSRTNQLSCLANLLLLSWPSNAMRSAVQSVQSSTLANYAY